MADNKLTQGYQFEFISSVPENLLCQKCNYVARRLVYTSCCGESYCQDCIADIQQEEKVCPACGKKGFTLVVLQKHVKQIQGLQIYCTMKNRGCDWTGLLGQLEEHLNSDEDGCQFMDVKCPLNCSLAVHKNELKYHMEQLCNKRQHVCQHCGFKDTYEEVLNIHLPECKYVPLQCPNRCGVCCEREDMEDHLNTCRLQEMTCEFKSVGCEEKFLRENEEEHIHQNSQSHLSMTAATLVTVNQQLQHRVHEQQDKIQDLEKKVRDQDQKIQEQDQKIQEQDQKIKDMDTANKHRVQEQQDKIQDLEKKVRDQDQKIQDMDMDQKTQMKDLDQKQYQRLQDLQKQLLEKKEFIRTLETQLSKLDKMIFPQKKFTIDNFGTKKETIYIPPMYTHLYGYKFTVVIYPKGNFATRNKAMLVHLYTMQGEYDEQLVWPAKARVTLELVNQKGGNNIIAKTYRETSEWNKPEGTRYLNTFTSVNVNGYHAFMELSNVDDFINNDTLYFILKVTTLK